MDDAVCTIPVQPEASLIRPHMGGLGEDCSEAMLCLLRNRGFKMRGNGRSKGMKVANLGTGDVS